jgi:uncharacterized lipoprotein YddW (UPF0748 family)
MPAPLGGGKATEVLPVRKNGLLLLLGLCLFALASGRGLPPAAGLVPCAISASTDALKPRGGSPRLASKPDKLPPQPPAPKTDSPREELRGIWITTDSPRDWDATMKKLRAAGLNAAFVRIGQGGKVIYPSKVLPRDQWAADAGGDELARAIEAAHRHGVQLHAWKVCFHMSSARSPKAGAAANNFYERMARDDRLVRDSRGAQSYWLNPADPRNRDLETRVAGEVVGKYAVDGYHLDYIRYPDSAPGFDFHFGDVARTEFEKAHGRRVANWPADVISGTLKLSYEDWERDNVTRLVRQIRHEVKTRRPDALLSAAVWPNIHLHRSTVKQDWPRWCRERLLDFVVPMAYTADLDDFRTRIRRDHSYASGLVPFVAGIGNYKLMSTAAVVDQVGAARAAGCDGFVLFSINDPSDDRGNVQKGLVDRQLAVLAAGLTKSATLSGLGGPRFRFAPGPEILARRYDTLAVESGRPTHVDVQLASPTAEAAGPAVAIVSLEDLAGRPIGSSMRMTFKNSESLRLPLTASSASLRPVVRGRCGEGKAARSFVVRGPIVESVSASVSAELRTREQPPRRPSSGLCVGVYSNGLGSQGVFAALDAAQGVSPVWVHHLRPTHLAAVDVLVLPQLFDLGDLTPKVVEAVRTWVHAGGRIVVTHDAVGLRWHPRMFPEVGKGVALHSDRRVQVARGLAGFADWQRLEHGYSDHARLELASAAKLLVAEQKTGIPVVAAGRFGRGLVILDGLIPGYEAEADSDGMSCRVLLSLVQYREKQ